MLILVFRVHRAPMVDGTCGKIPMVLSVALRLNTIAVGFSRRDVSIGTLREVRRFPAEQLSSAGDS